MVVANIMYKLSSFANYSMLTYNKEDVINILNIFEDSTIAPFLAQEIREDGTVSQRMHFIAQNGLLLIQINSARIDITLNSNSKEGFQENEIPEIQDKLTAAIKNLYTIFSERAPLPHRLAWNTSYVYFEITDSEIKEFRKKFLKELDFFKNTCLNDNVIRYATQREMTINNETEKINTLATINSYITNPRTEDEVNGYKIDYDINTWQGNNLNRFSMLSISQFVDGALLIQKELNKEILP